MPICKICNNKWSWKQTFKKTMTWNPELTCPYCDGIQYQSKKSKMKAPFLSLLTLSPLLIQAFFDVPAVILLILIPILAIITLFIYPFLVELSSKEEFPFSD